jgi:excisionase family DNA binding protein
MWPYGWGFAGVAGRSVRGQARAFAGKTVTNLRPPCGHGIRAEAAAQAQAVASSAARRRCAGVLGLRGKGGAAENCVGGEWPRSSTEAWMSEARTQYPTRWLSTREAAAALGVHERTLRRYVSSGLLGCRRLPGGHYRIPEEAIHEFWGAGDAPVRGGRRRQPGAERSAVNASGRVSKTRPRRARRPRLGDEDSGAFYDLSSEALAALRARVAVGDG